MKKINYKDLNKWQITQIIDNRIKEIDGLIIDLNTQRLVWLAEKVRILYEES